MKTWNRILGVGIATLLTALLTSAAFAQMASVSRYTLTTESGTWIDATNGGTRLGGSDDNIWRFNLPFDIVYDSTTITSGTQVGMQDDGDFSLKDFPNGANYCADELGNSTYPGSIAVFNIDWVYNAQSPRGNYWSVTGSAPNRILTMEWYQNSVFNNGSGTTSFELQIHETSGVIEFLYADHGFSTGTSDCGHGAYVGLNGMTSPTTDDNVAESGVTSIPSTDFKFSPPVTSIPSFLSLSPTSLDFGTATPNTPDTLCVTASNLGKTGAHPLTILGAFTSGSSAYSIIGGPSVGDTISAGGSVQYCIQFLPLTGGRLNASFTLYTDADSGGTTKSVSLTGYGAVPGVTYGVTSLFHQVRVMLSDTSPEEYVPITSSGGGPLHIFSMYFIGLDANSYYITRTPANPLQVDVTDSIGIRFTPTIEGRPDASLVIHTDAANIPWDTIPMFGVGTLPHLVITVPPPGSGNTVMFDSVAIGDSVCQTLMLTNVGTDTLQILQQLVTYGDYDFTYHPLMGTDTSVPPGDTVYANVCFKPLKQGTRVATIRFFTNIPPTFTKPSLDTGEFDINVTGIGVPYGALALSGKVRDTAIVTETNCLSDTITNAGLNDVTVDSIGFAPDTASFTANIVAPFVLAAHSSLGVSLCFTAKMRGTEQDTLFLIGTSSEQPVIDTVVLYGVGVETCVAADSMITFGADSMTLVNSTDTTCLTVTNCGDLPAIYTASTPTGAGYTLLSPIMDTVAAGGATHFCVSFHPTAIGAVPGSILVTGGPNAVTTLLEGVGAGVVANGSGTLTTPVMEGKCDTFDITITNTGNAAWTPGTGTITGANAADFTITTQATPATIAPGGTATVTIDFCPTTSGTESMTLTFLQAAPVPVAGAFSYSTTAIGASAGVTMKSAQDGFVLGASYPNPTNEKAAIELTLPKDANVRIDLLNATGELVRTAFSGHLSSGTQTVTIDAKGLPSGTYFYMLTSGDVRLTRQLSLVK